MNYKVQHITNTRKLTKRDMETEYITIHSTGNEKSTAQNERDNLNRVNNSTTTGFHLVVDDKQIIECIPLDMVVYHAGDGVNGLGNTKSIGIEMCESGDRSKVIENTVQLVAKMLYERGWGLDKLKRHYDWSGKSCPRILMANNWSMWDDFKNKVQAHIRSMSTSNTNITTLYRVQVGAYAMKSNAEKMLNDLKLAGFNGFIKTEDREVTESIPIPVMEYKYYETHSLKIIETYPKNIYVAALPGKNLREFGIWGINGTWQNNEEAHLPRSIWGLAANKHGAIGPNSYQNSPNGYKRGTLIYYQDGSMEIKRINNLKEITKPIEFAIGGGSLIPFYDPTQENIASDILRNTHHTALGYKGNRIYLIVTSSHCTMATFRQRILNLKLDGCIFLDGGGSTQMNWQDNKGLYQSRKLSHGIFVKGVK